MASIIRSNGNLIFQTLDKNATVQFVRGNLDSAENATIDDWTKDGVSAKFDFKDLVNKSSVISDDYVTNEPAVKSVPDQLDSSTESILEFDIPNGVDVSKISNVSIKTTYGTVKSYSIDSDNKIIKVDYVAPPYDSSNNDSTDNVQVAIAEAGKLFSKPLSVDIKINKVEFAYDQSIQVSGSDFETYSYKSKGLKWQ